jgi:hypothetical protein
MKKIFANILLIGLLFSMAAAQSAQKKVTKPAAKSVAAAKTSSLVGWISDEQCGVKVDKECAKKCQGNGAKMVFVDNDKKNVMPIANQDATKNFIGEHVNVKGKVDNGTLTIASITKATK